MHISCQRVSGLSVSYVIDALLSGQTESPKGFQNFIGNGINGNLRV